MKTFTTPKGTALYLEDLQGKDYLPVSQRLLWFREEHPDWGIVTLLLEHSLTHAIYQATIMNDQGRIISSGHGTETKQGFAAFFEKAETIALGRALAHAGFGTQFATELEEGEKLSDAPQSLKSAPRPVASPSPIKSSPSPTAAVRQSPVQDLMDYHDERMALDLGDTVFLYGKDPKEGGIKGLKFKEVRLDQIENYAAGLRTWLDRKGEQPKGKMLENIEAAERFADLLNPAMNGDQDLG